MEASLEKKNAVVTYSSAKVTTEQIEATIEELGFECQLQGPPEIDG